MDKSYYLKDISLQHKKDPRHFLKPTEEELDGLKVGEMVRLFFVFKFETTDGCRAERMWVEISEIDNHQSFKGFLTNQSLYIKDLEIGDVVAFNRDNIASIIIPSGFDEKKKAIITERALTQKAIHWLVSDEPNNPEDSGWQFFYGDEDDEYLSNSNNAALVTLEEVLQFEPRLEKVFLSKHNAFEWNEQAGDFVEVHDYEQPEE